MMNQEPKTKKKVVNFTMQYPELPKFLLIEAKLTERLGILNISTVLRYIILDFDLEKEIKTLEKVFSKKE